MAKYPNHNYPVFVYGTLKRGQSNHRCLQGSTYLGRRRMVGTQLHDLGPYPMALVTGSVEDVIHGELYAVNEEGLARLDQLEGYPSYYNRSALRLSDGTVAWIYHGSRNQVSDAPTVPMGDWATTPVLHYGSNLDPERLQTRCQDWDGEGVVVELEDWSWAIDKLAYNREPFGYAGIQACAGTSTWGVVTNLSTDAIAELDVAEGVRYGHYRRQRVRARTSCGTLFEALSYVPCEQHRRTGLQVDADYRNNIICGMNHWKLPAAWRNRVEASLSTTT